MYGTDKAQAWSEGGMEAAEVGRDCVLPEQKAFPGVTSCLEPRAQLIQRALESH